MGAGVWLLLGIVVIGGGLYVIFAVLAGIAGFANSVFTEIVEMLGRKGAAVASIPENLKGANPLPKTDPDKAVLAAWKPNCNLLTAPMPLEYSARSESIFKSRSELSDEIDVERVADILSMTSFRSYELAFSIIGEEPAYPQRPPVRPGDVEPLPFWTPWKPVFDEPSFTPPLWGAKLSFLNGFVMDVHKAEFDKVAAAKARKEELLAKCDERNKEVRNLAEKAQKLFEDAVARQEKAFVTAAETYQKNMVAFNAAFKQEQSAMTGLRAECLRPGESGLVKRIELAFVSMILPSFVSGEGETKFDSESGIVIHEHRFPDLSGIEWIKQMELKSGWTKKPANQKEKKEAAVRLHPSLCLRLAAEIARLDDEGVVKAIAINGWADYMEKSTGQRKRAYCASMFATKAQILALNLSALDPLEAFAALKGIAARSLELTPVAPIMRLDTNDPRFVDAKEILSKMAEGENLAAMDWEDFEHLCRELFERAFASAGAEVKVTQASRDQGVDAVVFDPDPLRGGKIVIQAKRYTNTVDVSAVRDLFGSVMNEGALKGILVTTSHFGPESYSFIKDKPLTLINGNELLGLLEKHGYKFRINLTEAKAML